MGSQRRFSLNGLVDVVVEGPQRYLSYFDNEYARISCGPAGDSRPVVTLRIVPSLRGGEVRSVHYKELFNFRYSIERLDTESPILFFESHWLDRIYVTAVGAFIQGQLLEPIIYQKLLEHGFLFMHAAGVSKNGKAYVFPAEGGTGKTTLSLALMRQGYQLMGDDLLMVDAASGTVFPYARPLHLFTYNLRTLKVPVRIRTAIFLKDVIRSGIALVTGRTFLISTRAHVEEVVQTQRSGPAQLARAVFLRREGISGSIDTSQAAGLTLAIDEIIASADLNLSLEEHFGMSEAIRQAERSVIGRILQRLGRLDFVNARALQTDEDRAAFAVGYL